MQMKRYIEEDQQLARYTYVRMLLGYVEVAKSHSSSLQQRQPNRRFGRRENVGLCPGSLTQHLIIGLFGFSAWNVRSRPRVF